jgi:predicted DNA-binding transcriptional regulator AlpA
MIIRFIMFPPGDLRALQQKNGQHIRFLAPIDQGFRMLLQGISTIYRLVRPHAFPRRCRCPRSFLRTD